MVVEVVVVISFLLVLIFVAVKIGFRCSHIKLI